VPDTFLEKHSSPQQTEQKHNLNVVLTRETTGKDIQMSNNNNNYLMMERIINNKYTFISVETLTTGRCCPHVLVVYQKWFRRVDGNKTT
jgi:hypothetical protein